MTWNSLLTDDSVTTINKPKNNSGRFLMLDTETTGFNVMQGDEIIEVGIVEMINGEFTGNNFHGLYRPFKNIDISAQNVHGISLFDLEFKPILNQEEAYKILQFINGGDLVIHNAKFDMNFLNHQFKSMGIKFSENVGKIIDSLEIARTIYKGARNSLDALCDRFEISRDNRGYHGAVVDCLLLGQVFNHLLMNNHSEKSMLSDSQKINFDKIC